MEEYEEIDVETIEFALDEKEIDELIKMLQNLKESKDNFCFEIDDENELVIHYDKDSHTC